MRELSQSLFTRDSLDDLFHDWPYPVLLEKCVICVLKMPIAYKLIDLTEMQSLYSPNACGIWCRDPSSFYDDK